MLGEVLRSDGERHDREWKVAVLMYIFCTEGSPSSTEGCQKNVLVCLYKCKPYRKSRCAAYDKVYDQLKDMDIPPKYIERYGEPILTPPYSRRVRRKAKQQKPKVTKRR